MSWFSGSGFGALLKGIALSPSFQQSAFEFVQETGKRLLDSLSNGDMQKVQLIAQNLVDNPEVAVGAMVKGTEAEKLVDPEVIKKSDKELSKQH